MNDILVKRRELFFNNLVLLGLDKVSLQKKHGITFNKDMFVLPNKKGYEVVTHFLFSKLNAATGIDYNVQWPLLCKEHDRMFQKTCYAHLVKFSQENCVKFPRIVPSLLSTFGGDRFYNVYLAFSSYVLKKTILKNENINFLSRPSTSKESYRAAKEILQVSTVLKMRKFTRTQCATYQYHKVWQTFAKDLEECLKKLKLLSKTYEELEIRNKKIISSMYSMIPEENVKLGKVVEECLKDAKLVKNQRKILNELFASEQKCWQCLSPQLVENESLNGLNYNICASENIPEEYFKDLKNVDCESSVQDGKLSIIRFIKLFMAHLSYLTDLFNNANLKDFHPVHKTENETFLADDLKSIKNFNKKLREDIMPAVEESIEKLKSLRVSDGERESLTVSCSQLFSTLPVVHFDVEAVETKASHFDSSLNKFTSFLSRKHKEDSCRIPVNNSSFDNSFKTLSNQPSTVEDLSTNSIDIFTRTMSVASSCTSVLSNKENISETSQSRSSITDYLLDFNIDDIDHASSDRFKMRESWLLEESLNAMTLPEMPFDD